METDPIYSSEKLKGLGPVILLILFLVSLLLSLLYSQHFQAAAVIMIIWAIISAIKLVPTFLLKKFEIINARQLLTQRRWQIFSCLPTFAGILTFFYLLKLVVVGLSVVTTEGLGLFVLRVFALYLLLVIIWGHLRLAQVIFVYQANHANQKRVKS